MPECRGAKRVTRITDSTREALADIITDGIETGRMQGDIVKSIQAEMGANEKRARLIASNETITSLNAGSFDMMAQAGAKTKTWHHRAQRNPRDGKPPGTANHLRLDGETRGIQERFSNNLRFPRDTQSQDAGETINCRCYVTYGDFG